MKLALFTALARRGSAIFVATWLVAAQSGCKSDALPSSSTTVQASSAPGASSSGVAPTTHDEVHNGIRFLVTYRGGADDHSPLLIGMHGRGGSPERFLSRGLQDFSGRAELALAQGPTRSNFGWEWFPGWKGPDDGAFVAAFDAAEKQLWQAIAELARGRRVMVTGFSQGGMLSYALAARHPREIAYAFPMGGGLFPEFLPRDRAATAPVYALHGDADDVVNVAFARDTIAAFKAVGGTAELREFPGVGHDMTPDLRADLFSHIAAAIAAEQKGGAPMGPAAP